MNSLMTPENLMKYGNAQSRGAVGLSNSNALLSVTTGDIDMTERIGTLKSSVEGPRWAAFPKFLKDACFSYDLEILHMEVDKGWIRETVRFKVEGSESNLNRLKRAIEAGVEQYNT